MVTRLSGGLTPADGSDPRTFPAIWNVTADEIEAQGTAISGAESDIDDLEAKNIPAFGTAAPSDGDVLTFDSASSEYVPEPAGSGTAVDGQAIYRYADTVYYTSNGTFSKGDYPWLRAIRVKCVGGGGGGANKSANNEDAAGGGGGGYAESFITNISGLSASETVTIGSGGGGAATGGNNDGGDGGNSSFGSLVVGVGGDSASLSQYLGGDGGGGTGDLIVFGGDGESTGEGLNSGGGSGGSSHLGGGARGGRGFFSSARGGRDAQGYGGGGGGASGDYGGGSGHSGIVIVELFA